MSIVGYDPTTCENSFGNKINVDGLQDEEAGRPLLGKTITG